MWWLCGIGPEHRHGSDERDKIGVQSERAGEIRGIPVR
jgi:hypothetical protein